MKIKWSPAREVLIFALVGRIEQLEDDFVERRDLIAYGFEVRGANNIQRHLDKTLAGTDRLEADIQPAIEQEFPNFNPRKTLGVAFNMALASFWVWDILYFMAEPSKPIPTICLPDGR